MNLNREALRVIRERSGHSKASLAEIAGIDRSLITRLENGERTASTVVIVKLATALQVPVTSLMGPSDGEAAA